MNDDGTRPQESGEGGDEHAKLQDDAKRAKLQDDAKRAKLQADAKLQAEQDDDENRPSPFGWFPIIMLILLVGGGLYFMFALRDVSNIQDCVQSGRKNCAPIDTSNLP